RARGPHRGAAAEPVRSLARAGAPRALPFRRAARGTRAGRLASLPRGRRAPRDAGAAGGRDPPAAARRNRRRADRGRLSLARPLARRSRHRLLDTRRAVRARGPRPSRPNPLRPGAAEPAALRVARWRAARPLLVPALAVLGAHARARRLPRAP